MNLGNKIGGTLSKAAETFTSGPTGGSGGISYTPETVPSWDEWLASDDPDAVKFRKDLKNLSGLKEIQNEVTEKMRIEYERKRAEKMQANLAETIPQVIEASTVNPDDIKHLSYGAPLDYSKAIEDLYDPTADYARAEAALFDPSTIKRDTAGRDAQLSTIDYYKALLANGGQDAVSEANYRRMRSDAEQAARAQRQAAMQNLAEQGRDTGGAGVLAELMSARDVGRNANAGALASKAMEQQRRDSAAASMGTLGGQVQTGDDAWSEWFGGEQTRYGRDKAEVIGQGAAAKTGYGQDKSGIHEAESLSNWNRTNAIDDANVGLDNQAMYHNKDLPRWGFGAYSGTTGNQANTILGNAASAEEAQRYEESQEFDPWAFLAQAAGTAGQIYQFAGGGPAAPKFDTRTGEAFYDPQTGKRYG